MTEPLEVVLELEVADWLSALDPFTFGRLSARIEKLAEDRLAEELDYFLLSVKGVPAWMPGELRVLLLYHRESEDKDEDEDFAPNITYFVCNRKAHLLTVYRAMPAKVEDEKYRATNAWIQVVGRDGCESPGKI